MTMVSCRCDNDSFVSPLWTNPRKGEVREVEEDVAAHLSSLGLVTVLKVEPAPEKKSGSSAPAGQASAQKTSKPRGRKSTKPSSSIPPTNSPPTPTSSGQ